MDAGIWKPARLDLAISALIALGLPWLAGWLFDVSGAFVPLLLYYGLAWGLALWRRGSSGYRKLLPRKISAWFYLNVAVILGALLMARWSAIVAPHFLWPGMLATAFIWAPLNAATEQILWIYIFEAWDLYPGRPERRASWLRRLAGLLLFSVFVGLIHTAFWLKFLHTVEAGTLAGIIFVSLTSLSGYLHLVVWRKTGNMLFTFIPHLLLNLVPIFWTGYSILPWLFR